MTMSLRAPRSQLLVASVAFLLGLLVVIQIRAQSGGYRLAALSAQDLTLLVGNLNAENDRLRGEIAGLNRQLDSLELGGTRGTASVADIQADLERIREGRRTTQPLPPEYYVCWTINRTHEMRHLLHMGVSGILTDFPALLRRRLNRQIRKDTHRIARRARKQTRRARREAKRRAMGI